MRGAQRGLDRHGHSRKGPTTLQEHKGQRPGDGPGRQGESSNRPPEVPVAPIATKNGEPLKRRRANRNNFSNRLPPVVAALTVLPVRSSQGRRLFCRFSDQTPALKCVMTDNLHRTCPHCGGKNTSYFIGIEESVWFTTKYETANGLVLFACSDTNRHKCPNLPKLEPAIAQHDNDTGGDALTP
jgi:hypothetical protein